MVQLGESIPEIAFSEGVSKGILHACSIVPYDGHMAGLGSHHPINRDHEKNEVEGFDRAPCSNKDACVIR